MTTTADWAPLADQLVNQLRAKGAVRTDAIADAIAAVPRHLFINGHYATGTHTTVDPDKPSSELLELAYSDRGIMTHIPGDAAGTFSSASQPSIVAKMLEAAHLSPGRKALGIGAGTGYHDALIARITGMPVTTVEFSAVVADEARTNLKRAGVDNVNVITGDGYHGYPQNGPYDLIVVTCGIAGIPVGWGKQLTEGGTILAPVAHGGMHPLMRITRTPGGFQGHLVTTADFMQAGGPLYAGATLSPSTREAPLPAPDPNSARRLPMLDNLELRGPYADLWMYLACRDPRTTCAGAKGTSEYTGCTLVEGDTAVFIRPDALYPNQGAQSLADHAATLVHDWHQHGRPSLSAWACEFATAGTPEHPLYTPTSWGMQSSR